MNLYIAADHAGWDLKEKLIPSLRANGHTVDDLSAPTLDPNDDYPAYAHALATRVAADPASRGIILCGSAEGVCIVANKTDGIRAGIGFSTEATHLARQDDDINVLCLPGRLMSSHEAQPIVDMFLTTPFSGLSRHKRRLDAIKRIEQGQPPV